VSAYWRVAGAYWKGPTSVQAWSLTLISLVLVVGNVVVQYGINLWNRSFFNALQQRDQSFVYQAIAIFLALAFAAAVVAVLQLVFGGPTEAMSVKKTAAAALSQRPNATAPTRRSK
jgi:putative ATP-binding cassette transporter